MGAGRQLDNGPCGACRRSPFKGAAGREGHIIFSLFLLLSALSLTLPLGRDMAADQFGKSCGRFGKGFFPPATFSLSSLCVVINWRGHIQDEKQVSQEKCESLYAFSWYQHQLTPHPSCPLSFLRTFSTSVSFPFLHCLSGSAALLPLYPFPFSCCSLFTLGLPECVFVSVC